MPVLAQISPAIFNALLALSARQIERRSMDRSFHDSLELNSEAISSLTLNPDVRDPDVLIAACILCVLEMMSVNPREWRHHIGGCAAFFQASAVNGFSGGILSAAFWCYTRMEFCGAAIAYGTEGTILPIEKWVLLDKFPARSTIPGDVDKIIGNSFLEMGRQTPDMYVNYAVYLCAKVCNLTSRRTRYVELGEDNGCNESVFVRTRTLRWVELQLWYEMRPVQMVPTKNLPGSNYNGRFPQSFFAHWAAISSNQLYHTACTLMLESMRTRTSVSSIDSAVHSPLWHARQIVVVSLMNLHRACLNYAIIPLFVAGKLFSHQDEQIVIVDLLKKIESCSG